MLYRNEELFYKFYFRFFDSKIPKLAKNENGAKVAVNYFYQHIYTIAKTLSQNDLRLR